MHEPREHLSCIDKSSEIGRPQQQQCVCVTRLRAPFHSRGMRQREREEERRRKDARGFIRWWWWAEREIERDYCNGIPVLNFAGGFWCDVELGVDYEILYFDQNQSRVNNNYIDKFFSNINVICIKKTRREKYIAIYHCPLKQRSNSTWSHPQSS